MKRLTGIVALGILLGGCSDRFDPYHENPDTGRWFSPAQVAEGEALFARYCAQCHGDRAQATPGWTQPDAEGLYPPPPLNGTAHAWHHPYPVLEEIILNGSRGRMPAWKGTLDKPQVASVIAWFQSLWPEQGYRIWQQRHRSN
ncbi:cytochrome c [Motiliproteus sp. SC1-56]|uniref:c-type cytochrome n=1 Tax=Motiliproteus sp. SC1-56 TaxID=2799565 RepID=UPI001A909C25|nr:cytochrome c [Motiliproteus sp. SC1-56]